MQKQVNSKAVTLNIDIFCESFVNDKICVIGPEEITFMKDFMTEVEMRAES
jgi:hypothetical protein